VRPAGEVVEGVNNELGQRVNSSPPVAKGKRVSEGWDEKQRHEYGRGHKRRSEVCPEFVTDEACICT
jgi:hypothetical protein